MDGRDADETAAEAVRLVAGAGDAVQSDQMRTDSDPDLVEIDSRGLPPDALEWADTTASEVVRQPGERNCATVLFSVQRCPHQKGHLGFGAGSVDAVVVMGRCRGAGAWDRSDLFCLPCPKGWPRCCRFQRAAHCRRTGLMCP
jgi:hypothetical protein